MSNKFQVFTSKKRVDSQRPLMTKQEAANEGLKGH